MNDDMNPIGLDYVSVFFIKVYLFVCAECTMNILHLAGHKHHLK